MKNYVLLILAVLGLAGCKAQAPAPAADAQAPAVEASTAPVQGAQ